jgi:uncharacterized protein (TIGR02145 family)
MKNLYIALALLISGTALGQIEQNVNKTSGTVSNAINDIDSIRFNAGQTEMQIILNNGTAVNHAISDINNVTFSGSFIGEIEVLNCASAAINGTLDEGLAASGVSVNIAYTGGNGGPHNGQIVTSTGVTGLTATLGAGTFANGAGTLTYTITGTPTSAGTASFAINIGGQTCNITLAVSSNQPQYPAGSIFCASGPTAVVNVTNPTTGKIWMDRNLGATQVATSSTDANSYGDLYQWGRRSDGHQCRTSPTTATLSSVDQPAHGDFILTSNAPHDWRSPNNNNLWQGVNGVNNPCPSGYRLPTATELNDERLSWQQLNSSAAFASPLKLPVAGYRFYTIGNVDSEGIFGYYWSSSFITNDSRYLTFGSSFASVVTNYRAVGRSVRCIKD